MDVATLGLTAFLPPLLAGRVFLGIVLLVMLTGTVALHRVIHGRFSPWPLLAGFFVYNWIFLFGFVNYLFGVGVMLWCLALWLAMARAGAALRSAVGTILAIATMFCHLVAFGLFAVILGGLALTEVHARWRATRRVAFGVLLVPAIPVAITLGLFVVLSPTAGAAGQPFLYAPWYGWKPLVAYRTLLWSIPWLNVATIGPLAALIAVAAWRRRLRPAPFMLLPVGLLFVTFLAMPNNLFGGQYADARLPIAILLVVIASVDLIRVTPRTQAVCIVLAVAALLVRSTVIARDWRHSGSLIAEYNKAFEQLPAGATLYTASVEPFPKLPYVGAAELARWQPPLKHLSSLASIGRDVFVPATWADPRQQPISVRPDAADEKTLQGDNPFLTPTADSLADVVRRIRALRPAAVSHDYLLLLRPGSLQGTPPGDLVPIARGGSFTLFRVDG